jgi:lipopolysaccharide transport system ATP-binding protein
MKPAIEVRNLGKEYQLGLTHTNLLSEKLGNGLRAIGRRFKSNNEETSEGLQIPHGQEQSFWALKDINFDVQQGEVMGVIGRNGAGKSTLLKILSRITSPTTGEVNMKGRVASLLEVGTGFHPELTGRENIYLNGAILGMKRQEINCKFDEIVAFAEVEKFIDTPVKRYSSGMYVRLAFAVAAYLEPEILLVDEVLAVGDLAFQKKCLNKMEDVSGEGRTVLFVSHNMASIKRLCHSAILLEEGRLKMLHEAHQVITSYYDSGQPPEPTVFFNESDHRTMSELQITQLTVLRDDVSSSPVVYQDDPIIIRLVLKVRKAFEEVRIGIEVYREGVLVTSLHSPPTRFELSSESTTLVCRIPHGMLLPGFYELHIGGLDLTTGRGLDWIPDAFSLHVLDMHSDAAKHYDEREKGMVRVPVTWAAC